MATCESTVYLVFVDVSKSSQLKFVFDCPGQVDFPFCQVTLASRSLVRRTCLLENYKLQNTAHFSQHLNSTECLLLLAITCMVWRTYTGVTCNYPNETANGCRTSINCLLFLFDTRNLWLWSAVNSLKKQYEVYVLLCRVFSSSHRILIILWSLQREEKWARTSL